MSRRPTALQADGELPVRNPAAAPVTPLLLLPLQDISLGLGHAVPDRVDIDEDLQRLNKCFCFPKTILVVFFIQF